MKRTALRGGDPACAADALESRASGSPAIDDEAGQQDDRQGYRPDGWQGQVWGKITSHRGSPGSRRHRRHGGNLHYTVQST